MRLLPLVPILVVLLAGLPTPPQAEAVRPEPLAMPSHELTLRVIDARTREPLAARVTVLGSGGESIFPLPRRGGLYHEAYFGHRYFYLDGAAQLRVPEGSTTLRVFHGFEFVGVEERVVVDRDMEYTVYLQRFVDMRTLGWRSGDTHIHLNHGGYGDVYDLTPPDMQLIQRAEDLGVANVLDNGPDFTGSVHPLSDADHKLFFGIEFRSAFWGHLGVLGTSAATSFNCCSKGQPAFPMNVDLVQRARDLGGTVVFAHPVTIPREQVGITDAGWPFTGHGRELPIDVALGEIDAIDVMSYSNRQRVEYQTWYDLLNHGFHIPATAGTDASINRWYDPPAGGYRVYARAPGSEWSYEDWLDAVRRGESFITNGPLIRYFLLENANISRSLSLTPRRAADDLRGMIEVVSQWPLSEARILVNGQVVTTVIPTGTDRRILRGTFTINTRGRSAWVAAHVVGFASNPFTIGSVVEAHTNPIYVQVSGKPIRFGGHDPGYYVRWVDDVWSLAQARGFATDADRTVASARIERARRVLFNRTILVPDRQGDEPPDLHGEPNPAPAEEPDAGIVAVTGGPADTAEDILAIPNPARGSVAFSLGVGHDLPERFELYDVQGRLVDVRRIADGGAENGIWRWDTGSIRERPPGVYFALFRGLDTVRRVRLVLAP